jgi:hypothetical protein
MKTFLAVIAAAVVFAATSAFSADVHVFCGSVKVTAGGRLATAAASANRTLIVHGTCTENMTVRNLRVTIDLATAGGSIVALHTGTPAITFTGGTTDATITGGTVANTGTGGAIVIDRNASVTVQNVTVNVGGGDAIGIRRGGLATLNTNTVNGPGTSPSGRGIRLRDQALMALGTGGAINTINNIRIGITCRGGSVVNGVSGNTGLANFTGASSTTNDGVPVTSNSTVTPGGPSSCFNDL